MYYAHQSMYAQVDVRIVGAIRYWRVLKAFIIRTEMIIWHLLHAINVALHYQNVEIDQLVSY